MSSFTLRELIVNRWRQTSAPIVRKLLVTNRLSLNEEIRSRMHFMIQNLREHKPDNSFYNLFINTPEFSRFVFVVPTGFLVGVGFLSMASPGTMPLVFEKVIPYHIKTIAVSGAFYSFADLAMHVIGRPTITSHRKWPTRSIFFAAYLSLLLSSATLALADQNAHHGYKACIGLAILGTVPLAVLTMPGWMKVWRSAFLFSAITSAVLADRRLAFYESNWDSLIFSADL